MYPPVFPFLALTNTSVSFTQKFQKYSGPPTRPSKKRVVINNNFTLQNLFFFKGEFGPDEKRTGRGIVQGNRHTVAVLLIYAYYKTVLLLQEYYKTVLLIQPYYKTVLLISAYYKTVLLIQPYYKTVLLIYAYDKRVILIYAYYKRVLLLQPYYKAVLLIYEYYKTVLLPYQSYYKEECCYFPIHTVTIQFI